MSLIDDHSAEIDARLDLAWQKCGYGKKYSPAYEVALRIKAIREVLSGKSHSPGDQLVQLLDKIQTMLSNIRQLRSFIFHWFAIHPSSLRCLL